MKEKWMKRAIESCYNVRVIKINTSNLPTKKKRVGKFIGSKAKLKKVIVTLDPNDEIPLFSDIQFYASLIIFMVIKLYKPMTQNKIAKILIQTIIKELGGKLNGQGQYLDGMGTQFSFDLNGKSFSVDLWDEDVVKEFNK